MSSRFYKEQYLISIYDETETCVGVCDNVSEFARTFGMKYKAAQYLISKLSSDQQNYFMFEEVRLSIHLIPLEYNDIIDIERDSKNEVRKKVQSMRMHSK